MKKKKLDSRRFLIAGITVGIMVTIIIGLGVYFLTFSKGEANLLVIYHWWSSPGEAKALSGLVGLFNERYPNEIVEPILITGGPGYKLREVIKTLILAKEAPDTFQMHPTYEAKPYFDEGLLQPVDDIWKSNNLEKVIPKVVQSMCKFNGHYYEVPIDIHRVNLIWYNKKILDENEINPSSLTTWDAFFDACDKLKAAGRQYPIQISAGWTGAHCFESIIASQGIDFYEDWVNGKVTSAEDERLVKSLEILKKYLSYVNPDYAEFDWWNNATSRIISGEGAFNLMGDWANGDFKDAGMQYDRNYGSFPVPGTGNMYGLCIDTFQRLKNINHPKNLERWLQLVASKEGQDTFNPIKGSISARTDANVTKYDLYQKSAILDFVSVKYMFPSVVHGSGAPEDFKLKLADVMSEFMEDQNVTDTAAELTDYTKSIQDEYTINWELN